MPVSCTEDDVIIELVDTHVDAHIAVVTDGRQVQHVIEARHLTNPRGDIPEVRLDDMVGRTIVSASVHNGYCVFGVSEKK